MILSDLLDQPVREADGTPVGYVIDVRFVLDGPPVGPLATPRVHGVLVSPRTGSSFMGYERVDVRSPALLARWFAWRHRGTFLVHWQDVAAIDEDGVTLARDARRWAPGYERPAPA
ncbi:PRC-barrel domain-containing protein [Cellulomonas edaphi]|uniref:PRC-barrel domain containing protein n=1 Tax=Cellulomonas edaphi TaxID=3053468 RepID=A0ABT7S3R2_9CELL|nr:PRC-barrel domain containing protein [Cellulomons edaphi]MDM7830261.1 PRC-barrel domain containing protein [Cellulomons edaphi]